MKLSVSSLLFFLHALAPFVPIPDAYNLEAMSSYLLKKNEEANK